MDRRPVVLAVILLVGVTVRESALFLIPFVYAVWAERLFDARAVKQMLAVGAPAVAAYAVIRLAVPTVARQQVLGYDSLLGGAWTSCAPRPRTRSIRCGAWRSPSARCG